MKKLCAIDLFAGCGGLSKGFMDAGYQILIGIDNDQAALKTFLHNHKSAHILNADLSDFKTFDIIDKIINVKTVDVIIAGPPCQGFSLTGPRNFDDNRNKLYLAVFKAIKKYKPKAIVIENVPGMATLYKGEIHAEILNRFNAIGYNIESKIICAADYGVPQIRNRLIFIGIRKDIGKPSFPKATYSTEYYITCRQVISDLPSRIDEIGNNEDVYSCEPFTNYQKKCAVNVTYYIIMLQRSISNLSLMLSLRFQRGVTISRSLKV